MTETLTAIVQWLIPSGGLGVVIGWIVSRRTRDARTAKEVHDTYKQMYNDVRITLSEIQDENKRLFNAVIKLERAVSCATLCRYWHNCPIRAELPYHEGIVFGKGTNDPNGQPRIRNPDDTDAPGTGGQGGHDRFDSGHPVASSGSGLHE